MDVASSQDFFNSSVVDNNWAREIRYRFRTSDTSSFEVLQKRPMYREIQTQRHIHKHRHRHTNTDGQKDTEIDTDTDVDTDTERRMWRGTECTDD